MNGIISIGLQATSSGSGGARTADTTAAGTGSTKSSTFDVRHVYLRARSRLCEQ